MFGVSGLLIFLTVILVIAGGITARYLLRNDRYYRITSVEFGVATALILIFMIPGVTFVGSKIAVASAVNNYVEFWNGSLTAAKKQTIECHRDSSCVHEYNCDPYIVMVPKTHTRVVSDGKGGTRTETYTTLEPETRWHDCPYATRETSYLLVDSFGDTYTIASHWFDEKPIEWRNNGIPSSVRRGIPDQWAEAKANLDAGDPDPVTKVNKYKNYLLASQDTLLKQYSEQIKKYRDLGLLTDHTRNMRDEPIYNSYMADKVVFAGGASLVDEDEWQDALGRLNSRFGNERQGDLHVLIVPADKVDNPDEYTSAVLAYWQGDEFGKKALAKNTVMLVLGIDQITHSVIWSRAKTGVPEGNGAMMTSLSTALVDLELDPRTLLGWPRAIVDSDGDLKFQPSGGVVERIILEEFPYLRPCMDCKDNGDNGSGYVYLESSVQISTPAQILICFFVFLLSAVIFYVMAVTDSFTWLGVNRFVPKKYGARPRSPYEQDVFAIERSTTPGKMRKKFRHYRNF